MSKSPDRKAPCWQRLFPLDVSSLVAALAARPPAWAPVVANEPNPAPPPPEAAPVIVEACRLLGPDVVPWKATLSRLVPGVQYGYHCDGQPWSWITRVHIPLVNNPRCWFAWEEDDGRKVYMEVGWAYAFNTLKAHAYANEGEADRVHLMFDALKGGLVWNRPSS